jgi:small subunit ribosomal protein S6
MRKYELMVMLTPETDPTDTKKIEAAIAKMLGDDKKAIKNIDIVGKKRLAYEINKKMEAVYVIVSLEAMAIKTSTIDKNMKLMSEVIRYLLTEVKE